MAINYLSIDFKKLTANDLNIARSHYKLNKKDNLQKYLQTNQPNNLTYELSSLVRSHLIAYNMKQAYPLTFKYLIERNVFPQYANILKIPIEPNYEYQVIRTMGFSGWLDKFSAKLAKNPNLRYLLSLDNSDLKKWLRYLRLPCGKCLRYDMLINLLHIRIDFTNIAEYERTLDEDVSRNSIPTFNEIVDRLRLMWNHNDSNYIDLSIPSRPVNKLKDADILVVSMYRGEDVITWLTIIPNIFVQMTIDNALYIDANDNLVYGPYFTTGITFTDEQIKALESQNSVDPLRFGKLSMEIHNNIYDFRIVKHKMLLTGQFGMPILSNSKYSYNVERDANHYRTYEMNKNQPTLETSTFDQLRKYIIANPDTLPILQETGGPTPYGAYPSILVLFAYHYIKQDVTLYWLTPLYDMRLLQVKPLVYNPAGLPIIMSKSIYSDIDSNTLQTLMNNKVISGVDPTNTISVAYFVVDINDFIKGNLPIPIVRQKNTLIVETINSMDEYNRKHN